MLNQLFKDVHSTFNDLGSKVYKALGEPTVDKGYEWLKTKVIDKSLKPKGILYKGELHAVLLLPDGTYHYGNYTGPGSRLDIRVPRGDKPLTEVDKISQSHDLRYQLALELPKEEQMKVLRNADIMFMNKLAQIRKNKTDNEFNIRQASLIGQKMKVENLHPFLHKKMNEWNTRPSADVPVVTPQLEQMYRAKLRELERQGY